MMHPWLWPLSWMYGQAVAFRRRWQQAAPPRRLGVPVISVGNITCGGTGKTEAVVYLCRLLQQLGVRPAVLSRGYRRRGREAVLVVSEGSGPLVSPERAGDEPFLLASRLRGAAVVVAVDRVASGRLAIDRLGCQALVLDDGFQRRDQVYRDLDVVLLDAADPFGGEALLPAGRLREPLAALQEADALVVTRSDQYDPGPALRRLAQLAPDIPRYTARHAVMGLGPLAPGGPRQPPDYLAGRKVLAFSGIGRPQAFARTLDSLGAQVVGQQTFRDHHWFAAAELGRIQRQAERLGCAVVTTAKDAARLPPNHNLQGWVVEIEFQMDAGGLRPALEACLQQGKEKS